MTQKQKSKHFYPRFSRIALIGKTALLIVSTLVSFIVSPLTAVAAHQSKIWYDGSGSVAANETNCKVDFIAWQTTLKLNRPQQTAGYWYASVNDKADLIANWTLQIRDTTTNKQKMIEICDQQAKDKRLTVQIIFQADDNLPGTPPSFIDATYVLNVLQPGKGVYGGSVVVAPKGTWPSDVMSEVGNSWDYLDVQAVLLFDGQNPLNITDTGDETIGYVYGTGEYTPHDIESLPRMAIKGTGAFGSKGVKKISDIGIKLILRDKYRVSLDQETIEKDWKFNFGETLGIDWKEGMGLDTGQEFELPGDQDQWYNYDQDPNYVDTSVALNYKDNIKTGDYCDQNGNYWVTCKGLYWGTDGKWKSYGIPMEGVSLPLKPGAIKPVITKTAWTDPAYIKPSTTKGSVGQIEVGFVPVLWGDQAAVYRSVVPNSGWTRNLGLPLDSSKGSFVIEIFNTDAELKQACIDEGLDTAICDDFSRRRFEVGKEITIESDTTRKGDQGLIQDIFDLIRQILVAIFITLTGWVYQVFAFLIVPILNSLLSVRPYQDQFVEVIYPGWLIMRNLANVAFIVSLLVVGMRILFQQDQAGKSWQFIRTLVIMALLVNFSLVIAQGAVGIADTVQSQFLPADSRVLESLGQKLMAQPMINFSDQFSADGKVTEASDIFYPFVLLILCVAAFFSFIAICGFVFMRLVGLWVLYMVSPVAYFGSVLGEAMPEAKKIASQWWSKFIQYAISVPILAFFLNIAALMAVVFSNKSGSAIKVVTGTSDRGMQAVGNAVTEFALTIATHFIVLIFIYLGMQFAQKSGVAGSKAIVDFAQKGFEKTLKAPGKAAGMAKDWLADKAAGAAEDRKKPGLAKAITAAAKPVEFAKIKREELAKKQKEMQERAKRRMGKDGLAATDTEAEEAAQKYRDFSNSEKSDAFKTHLDKGDGTNSRGALYSMLDSGGHEDALKQMSKFNNKEYAKNAAGMHQAIEDTGKKLGWGKARIEQAKARVDRTAGKNSDTKHYSGGMTVKDGKRIPRQLDSSDPNGKFTDHKDWVDDQAKRSMKKGFVDHLKNAHIDAVVKGDGAKRTFTDQQSAMFANMSDDVLTNKKTREKFQSDDSQVVKAMKEVAKKEGLAGITAMLNKHYDQRGGPPVDVDVAEKARKLHEFLTMAAPVAPQGDSGGGSEPDDGGKPGGPEPAKPGVSQTIQTPEGGTISYTPTEVTDSGIVITGAESTQPGQQTERGFRGKVDLS